MLKMPVFFLNTRCPKCKHNIGYINYLDKDNSLEYHCITCNYKWVEKCNV